MGHSRLRMTGGWGPDLLWAARPSYDSPMGMEAQIFAMVIQGGALAIVAWLVLVVMPTERKADREQNKEQRTADRVQFSEELARERASNERLIREERETCERRHQENMAAHAATQKTMADNRHSINNLASSVSLHNALVDQATGIRRQEPK